jgi:hypothetical protein
MKGGYIMTVYVIVHGVDYEGEEYIGVYSTMEKAKNKIAEILKEDLEWNHVTEQQIKEWLRTKDNTFDLSGESYYIFTEVVDNN